jgi:outer membrane protein assembly factor BamB
MNRPAELFASSVLPLRIPVSIHARATLILLFVLLQCVSGLATPAQESPRENKSEDDNWPVYRGSLDGRGYRTAELPETLDILWQHKVDNGAFESTPVIQDGVAYIGDLDNKVYAFDIASGQLKWEFFSETGFMAAGAWRDDCLYIGSQDGVFYCLDASSGKEKWKFQAGAVIDSGAGFHGDNVIFGSQDATLYCLNRATGKVVWQHTLDDQIRCSPTIVDEQCLVAGCDGRLHFINAVTGEATGAVQIDSPTGVTPAALGKRVFFGTENAGFLAVDTQAKILEWRFADPDGPGSIRSCPATADGHVVFGSQNRKVHSLNPENGESNWVFETRGGVDSSPVIAGSRVYVGGTDGRMYVLSLKDGKKISECELNGKIIGSPAVSRGRLVIATTRGNVYCLGKKDSDQK